MTRGPSKGDHFWHGIELSSVPTSKGSYVKAGPIMTPTTVEMYKRRSWGAAAQNNALTEGAPNAGGGAPWQDK